MFAIDIIGVQNKMIPNASMARGAVTCSQWSAYKTTGVATAKHTVTHLKHFNVSIMTQVRYKALLIREIM